MALWRGQRTDLYFWVKRQRRVENDSPGGRFELGRRQGGLHKRPVSTVSLHAPGLFHIIRGGCSGSPEEPGQGQGLVGEAEIAKLVEQARLRPRLQSVRVQL